MTMVRSALAALLFATLLGRAAAAWDDDNYIGSIELVGFPYCTQHRVPAWGQVMSSDRYAALYYLFGNRFGGDAAQKTFALPDLRGQTPAGMMYCVVIEGTFPTRQ